MPLPFVRQFPDGKRVLSEVTCSPLVEQLGFEFIAAGGRYVCEIMPDGMARIAACVMIGGKQKDLEVTICPNTAALLVEVDHLVSASWEHIGPEMMAEQVKDYD